MMACVRISVETRYLERESDADNERYVFAYQMTVQNDASVSAKLLRRHWIITDGNELRREVKGEGVVGKQPTIEAGNSFIYTSAVVLATPVGTMQGTYHFVDRDGTAFKGAIKPFLLAVPSVLN